MLAHDAAQCSSHQGQLRGCAVSILAGRDVFGAARYEFWRGEALSGLRGVDSGASGRFRGCAVSIHGRIVDSGAARRLRGRCAVSILARRRAFGAARYGFWRGGSLSAAQLRPLVFTCVTYLDRRNANVKMKRLPPHCLPGFGSLGICTHGTPAPSIQFGRALWRLWDELSNQLAWLLSLCDIARDSSTGVL